MARQRGFRQVLTTPRRRLTAWDDGTGGTGVTSISGPGSAFVGLSVAATADGLTVIRQRGVFRWLILNAGTAGDGFQGAFGIGIASLAAVTAGAASVPTPLTEQSSENWLYWRAIGIHARSATVASFGDESSESFEVDTKAMRKLPEDLALYAIIELVEIGVATASLFFDSRILSKLP